MRIMQRTAFAISRWTARSRRRQQCLEVEFAFADGEISRLVCSCFCGYNCKHALAAMLQLKETLTIIEKQYAAEYEQTGYFAAVHKGTLFQFAIDGKDTGRFVLQG